jgi:hypothetical protein
MYRIYGKHKDQTRFGAMDLKEGYQVGNLIYASMLTAEEKDRFMEKEAPRNPDWTFEPRVIPNSD